MSVAAPYDYAAATDQQLLALYQGKRDQHAFGLLVERYHAMVLGVARRMLGCPHAAEDVFQATFLVLARDAAKIRQRGSLASWLYAVTFRISARLVKHRAQRQALPLHDEVEVSDDPLRKLSEQFEYNAAFEELHRLPETVRKPMILRYLQGKSNAEVADDLQLSEAAVEGRLKRGRNQLRPRLARQGVTFAAAIAVLESAKEQTLASTTTALQTRTVEMCMASGAGTESHAVEWVRLAEQETMKMTTTNTFKGVFVACVALGVVAAGWSLSGQGYAFAQIGDPFGDADASVATPELDPFEVAAEDTAENGSEARVVLRRGASDAPRTENDNAEVRQTAGHYSVELRTPMEMRVIKALSEPTRVEFVDAPLAEVVAYLADYHKIQIIVDERGLEDEAIDASTDGITVDLDGIQLRNALKHMLRQLSLTTIIKDEVLTITSREVAEEHITARVYKIDSNWSVSSDDLVKIITKTVAPDSWDEVGGMGSIMSVDGGLVISQSYEVHEKVNELLAQLDQIY